MIKIGINGFGRIGRVIFRICSELKEVKLVAVNDINSDINNLAYLANYDSTYGPLSEKLEVENGYLSSENSLIKVFNDPDILRVPWDSLDIDILIDSSGISTNLKKYQSLKNKIKFIVVTNSPEEGLVDRTVAFGVNHHQINLEKDFVIASSICDATAFAPLAKLIDEEFKIRKGFLTTLHPWLGYQNLLDGPSKSYSAPGEIYDEYALGRSSMLNLIPKNTSAISATYKLLPNLEGKFLAVSYRVPTMIVSSADATIAVEKKTSLEELVSKLEVFEKKNPYILSNNYQALVSSDFIQNKSSVIIDHRFLKVDEEFLKILSWYDNEWGYSSRVVDLIKFIGSSL